MTMLHPLPMGQRSLDSDCLVAFVVRLAYMHTLRFTVTQVLIKLTFKQPVNVAASCTVQGFIKLLIQQQDRGPVVEAFCMSRGCLLIRCGLQEPMREPVIAADGQTYEKAALKSWLQQHDTSPVTGQPFFFFFWVGELFITHTWTCNERNHKCQTEGHPQPKLQATLTTWVEADTKVCKEATCQAKQAASFHGPPCSRTTRTTLLGSAI